MIKFNEWLPWSTAVPLLDSLLMSSGSNFVNENWNCKYVNARIDMRTGHMIFFPGNLERTKEYYVHPDNLHEKTIHCHEKCIAVLKIADINHLTAVKP